MYAYACKYLQQGYKTSVKRGVLCEPSRQHSVGWVGIHELQLDELIASHLLDTTQLDEQED